MTRQPLARAGLALSVIALLGMVQGRCVLAADDESPRLPVGLAAYREWESWPLQRIGQRTYMRSTYDRRGGNEGADASHFLYQQADDFNAALDVEGHGVLAFVRTNHWHGSPWHYEVDGRDHVIRETATSDPVHALERFGRTVFLPEGLMPEPLAWTWSTTKGADLNWVPISFASSLRLAYSRTRYGTGYYIYHLFDTSAPLSRPIQTWDGQTPPDRDVLDLVGRSGQRLLPAADSADAIGMGLRAESGRADLEAGQTIALLSDANARAQVRGIEMSVPRDQAIAFGRTRLRITWDGRAAPSVDAPVALFFGAGTLYNRDDREFLVKGFPCHIRFDADRVHLAAYWPMPYFKSARVELVGLRDSRVKDVHWRIERQPLTASHRQLGYFHATYNDHAAPLLGEDLVVLDTLGVEGSNDWSGVFAGMSWIFSHEAVLTTLEGDPRFFFDGSRTPQAYGTGTEEWGGGGDYWGGRTMTLPFAGHPVGAPRPEAVREPEDRIESAYRFLLGDAMPFGRQALVRLEHGGENQSREHYESVAYWYGAPGASLVATDQLDVGDSESEASHRYDSPEATPTEVLTSRFEWGPDTIAGHEVYGTSTENGRRTRGTSTFSLVLRPDNLGVVLTRRLDYGYANQRARVAVSEERPDGSVGPFEDAGIWYLAGSNTCVYSNPADELGATQHNVQTSNRRLRDDEFIIPRRLTSGRSRIRLRITCEPIERPLFPGVAVPESWWSELRYEANCWVLPNWQP